MAHFDRPKHTRPQSSGRMKEVGLCRICHTLVELDKHGHDAAGHGKTEMAGISEIASISPTPVLPRFNWGAFFMPPIWGAGHGQVFAVVLYPIWLMADNMVWAALHGTGNPFLAVVVVLGTLGFMAFYARTANYVGYRRVMGTMPVEDYVAGERRWTIAMALLAAAMIGFATWYNLTMRV